MIKVRHILVRASLFVTALLTLALWGQAQQGCCAMSERGLNDTPSDHFPLPLNWRKYSLFGDRTMVVEPSVGLSVPKLCR